MDSSGKSGIDVSELPPCSASLHNGIVFGDEIFQLLDDFHLPVALMDAWNGNWVEVIWMNKKHVKVLGKHSKEHYIAKINKKSANATATFEKRLQMWKNKVQVQLEFHTDPHKLFPDNQPPV